MPHPVPSRPSTRLHAFDALRAFALLLGIVLHASVAFLPGAEQFWIVHDPHPSAVLGFAFYVPHMFRMELFFLIAGFFGHMSLGRLGARSFFRDRLRRITLVFVVFWPITMAGIIGAAIFAQYAGLTVPQPAPHGVPLTHLWFLYVLTLAYFAILTGHWILARADRRQRLGKIADQVVAVLTTIAGPLILALPVALALLTTTKWLPWFGIPTPDMSLLPGRAACIAFGSAFLFGWILYPRRALMERWIRQRRFHLAVAVIGTFICLAMIGLAPSLSPAAHSAKDVVYAVLYAWAGWSWTIALIGFASRYMASPSPASRYLADASYWIYLLHLPLVMALQVYAVQLDQPAWIKFTAIVIVTVAFLLVTYRVAVRRTWIGAFINGRRKGAI